MLYTINLVFFIFTIILLILWFISIILIEIGEDFFVDNNKKITAFILYPLLICFFSTISISTYIYFEL